MPSTPQYPSTRSTWYDTDFVPLTQATVSSGKIITNLNSNFYNASSKPSAQTLGDTKVAISKRKTLPKDVGMQPSSYRHSIAPNLVQKPFKVQKAPIFTDELQLKRQHLKSMRSNDETSPGFETHRNGRHNILTFKGRQEVPDMKQKLATIVDQDENFNPDEGHREKATPGDANHETVAANRQLEVKLLPPVAKPRTSLLKKDNDDIPKKKPIPKPRTISASKVIAARPPVIKITTHAGESDKDPEPWQVYCTSTVPAPSSGISREFTNYNYELYYLY